MMIKKHGVKIACGLALQVVSVAAFANQESSGFTLSPMLGMYLPEGNRELDDASFLSIGAGYDFNKNWGAELSYLTAKPEVDGSNTEIDLDLLRLDALRYFGEGDLRPYAVAGLGEAEFDANNSDSNSETIANIGAGLKYAINDVFSIRGDARLMHGFDSSDNDILVGVGALFKFGTTSNSTKRSKPAVEIADEQVQKDSDNDGVMDADDQCPNTAKGSIVNSLGCVVTLDTDNDGVNDATDQCPDTEAGAKVDAKGCYQILKDTVSISLNVQFKTNSADVLASSYGEIEDLAQFLAQYPKTSVVVEGHTDSDGAATYNKQLSQKRAEAVTDILVETYSVNRARLQSVGFGEERPIASNDTTQGRAKNRRVTAVVSATTETIVK